MLDSGVNRKTRADDGIERTIGQAATTKLIKEAVKPIQKPALRNKIIELKRTFEQTIDTVSQDQILEVGYDANALDRAKKTVESFETRFTDT